jgi:ATP-dependent phosphoenolpyruvate carboxykinase
MSNAPICPVSRSQPTTRTPALTVATIPHAHDLRSVINAISVMNNVVQSITRGAPQFNNAVPPTVAGIPSPPATPRNTWEETSRNYRRNQIVNPDDKTQIIKIMTIASVEWTEQQTGKKLVYEG